MSPGFQNSQDPESLWSSVVRSAQRGKVIWCLEDKLKETCAEGASRGVASNDEAWEAGRRIANGDGLG